MLRVKLATLVIELGSRLESNLLEVILLGFIGFHAHLEYLTLVLVQWHIS